MNSETSRYRDCQRCIIQVPDLHGTVQSVVCLSRRRRPHAGNSAITGSGMPTLHDSGVQVMAGGQVLGAVQVKQNDRLDLLASQALGRAELSWMIVDANPCIFPDELVSTPAAWIVVPQFPGRNSFKGTR
jgi:hypothetical protein